FRRRSFDLPGSDTLERRQQRIDLLRIVAEESERREQVRLTKTRFELTVEVRTITHFRIRELFLSHALRSNLCDHGIHLTQNLVCRVAEFVRRASGHDHRSGVVKLVAEVVETTAEIECQFFFFYESLVPPGALVALKNLYEQRHRGKIGRVLRRHVVTRCERG